MKTRLHYLVVDGGDGSAYVQFFKTAADAEAAGIADFELHGEGFGEDGAGYKDLEFDDDGTLLNPDEIPEVD